MMGLLYKDNAIILSAYKKNALLVLVIYSAMAFMMDMPFMFYAMVILVSLYAAATLNFDEASHWDAYARTLPLSPAQIIGEKYILSIIWPLGGALIAFVLSLACNAIKKHSIENFFEPLSGIIVVFALALLYNALSFPLAYKYGASRARVNVMVALVIVCVGIPFSIQYLLDRGVAMPAFVTQIAELDGWQAVQLLSLLIPIALVLCAISCMISIKIYTKKEY